MRGTASTSFARQFPIATALAIASVACALACLLTSTAAAAPEATRTYKPGAFFGSSGSGPGQLFEPTQIAVESSTGNLLVTDTANARVQVFAVDSAGNPSYLTTLGTGTIVTPVGIAVDPGTGSIYVSDSGAEEVLRFASDGAPTPTYTLDATFTSPTLSSYASTLAVDPTSHDLLVADAGSQEVRRFDVADGSQISAFDGSDSPAGPFTSLRALAVSPSGTVYAVDEPYPEAVFFEASGGRIESFEADGTSLGPLGGIDLPGAVAADPAGGPVFATWNSSYYVSPRRLAIYEGGSTPAASANFPAGVDAAPASLAVGLGADRGVYALLRQVLGQTGIQKFKPAEIPAAEIAPISAITESAAHLSGSVAPGTLSGTGTARFEYSLDGSNWSSTPEQTGIAGPGVTQIAADLSDLRPNTTYSVRVHIANEDFSVDSAAANFTTEAVAPAVQLGSPTDRTATSVVLHGAVNSLGQQTTYHFEYGKTIAYGSSAPLGTGDVAGAGYDPRRVSHAITGLQADSTYHYRLVATNAVGTATTPDASFSTRAPDEETRRYELVTPLDKRGLVVSSSGFFRAKADGNGIVYQTKKAYDSPLTAGSPNTPRYASVRTAEGWRLHQLDVPLSVSKFPASPTFSSVIAISPDFSHALVGSDLALAPGAVEGVGNLFRRDVQSGSLELVASGLDLGEVKMQAAEETYLGGSADFSRIVFESSEALTPEATSGLRTFYEWNQGEGVEVASTLADGSPSDGSARGARNLAWPAVQSTSVFGESLYYRLLGSVPGLYLRKSGSSSLIEPGEVTLLDVTGDGRFAAYEKAGMIYRYDSVADSHQYIIDAPSPNVPFGFLGLGDNGASLFFGGPDGTLSAWHDGASETFATGEGLLGVNNRGIATSPNGRYFTFTSIDLVDSYDNESPERCGPGSTTTAFANRCFEVYLYDAVEKSLICVSCPADGRPPAGHAGMGAGSAEFQSYGPQFVNDRGQVFFDTPTALVAADTNGRRDVYEYEGDDLRLITPGTGAFDATFADVSSDGRDAFVLTSESLIAADRDAQPDIYDARVGGGFPSGSADTLRGCEGAECRAAVALPIVPTALASETVVGSRQAGRHRPRKHRRKTRHRKVRKPPHSKKRAGAHRPLYPPSK